MKNLHLGIKSDPIEYRYSFDWLFSLMQRNGVRYLQLGSFFELYWLDNGFFENLRESAQTRDVEIKSCFTAHRELGGFFTGNPQLERVARCCFERYIEIGGILGADFVGSNPGAVYRDRLDYKATGIRIYLDHMKELMAHAKDCGLLGLTMEPMSCTAEPPSLPEEIDSMMEELASHHKSHPDSTVPVYICGDVSHGVADPAGRVVHDNMALFERQLPYLAEFHFKNTDEMFNSTFGFSDEERRRGIVDPERVVRLIDRHSDMIPVDELVGYLEIGGPKLGRDYSDPLLERMLTDSLAALAPALQTAGGGAEVG
jgi:ribulose-phosphate 3-epimerase